MNRIKYRVWLIFIVFAAVLFGVACYLYMAHEEETITDATLVYRTEQRKPEEEAA